MADGKRQGGDGHAKSEGAARTPNGLLGSLRDALKAASRSDAVAEQVTDRTPVPLALEQKAQPAAATTLLHVASSQVQAPMPAPAIELRDVTTRIVRGATPPPALLQRTKLVRGKVDVERGAFHQDPVVAWLVIVGGAGLGAFRPVFEGNNTVGRGRTNRIAIDFGDESISSDEQAYIRYDSSDRSFLFVPNLSKTNVVSINEKRPTGAVRLAAMDVITMGRTQLAFVPFCGEEFDWSEIVEEK